MVNSRPGDDTAVPYTRKAMTVGEEALVSPMPQAAAPESGRKVMGPWMTLLLSFVTLVVFALLQTAVFIGFVAVRYAGDPAFDLNSFVLEAMYNGSVLSVSTLVTATLCTGLILIYVRFGSRSTVKDYLGLKPVAWKTVGFWFAVMALFVLLSDGLTYLLDRPVTPDFMVRTYATAGFLPLFVLALVVLGPLFEEVLFRGYMFAGLQHSRLGNPGAILVTAVLWAAIHLQYDIYGITTIFAMGILLGIARMKTGSLYLTFALHAAINLLAITQVVVLS